MLSSRLQHYDQWNFSHMQAELQRQGKHFAQLDSTRYEERVQSILVKFSLLKYNYLLILHNSSALTPEGVDFLMDVLSRLE